MPVMDQNINGSRDVPGGYPTNCIHSKLKLQVCAKVEYFHPYKCSQLYNDCCSFNMTTHMYNICIKVMVNAKNGGNWSPAGVFNATTSSFNFIFNFLDIMIPLEDEHIKSQKMHDREQNIYKSNKSLSNSNQQGSPVFKIAPHSSATYNHDDNKTKFWRLSQGINTGIKNHYAKSKHSLHRNAAGNSFEEKMLESNSIGSIELNSYDHDVGRFDSTSTE